MKVQSITAALEKGAQQSAYDYSDWSMTRALYLNK